MGLLKGGFAYKICFTAFDFETLTLNLDSSDVSLVSYGTTRIAS